MESLEQSLILQGVSNKLSRLEMSQQKGFDFLQNIDKKVLKFFFLCLKNYWI